MRLTLKLDQPSAIRYPRDTVPAENFENIIDPALRDQASAEWEVGKSRRLRHGRDATIICYGALTSHAMAAAKLLEAQNLSIGVIDARYAKPVDGDMLKAVLKAGHPVLTLEDHAIQNGFGTAVIEYAVENQLPTEHITMLGMPDRMFSHATRKEQLAEAGLDAPGIAGAVSHAIVIGAAPIRHTAELREKTLRLSAV
jgi:1-deoxy-D-xylulose-5-phosphate synthase